MIEKNKLYKINNHKLTIQEIVNWHKDLILKNACTSHYKKRKFDIEYELDLVPSKVLKKIKWEKLDIKTLKSIGFVEWDDGVFLTPIYLWELIPNGTKMVTNDGSKVVKSEKTNIPEEMNGMLRYGFMPKK